MTNTLFPPDAPPESAVQVATDRLRLEGSFKGGARWFYVIAGLSILNSALIITGADITFIFGLGITLLFDAVGREVGGIAQYITLTISFLIAAFFIVLGIFANDKRTWPFVVGIIAYSLDAVLYLVIGEFLGFGFHLFALFGIYTGFKALGEMKRLEVEQLAEVEGTPPAA